MWHTNWEYHTMYLISPGISFSEPLYVCGISAESNTVILGTKEELYRKEFDAEDFRWTSGEPDVNELRCKVKTRYRQPEQWAAVTWKDRRAHIVFDEPQRAVTPGQAAVLYDGDVVLGGGTII